ncbi:MAG: hypothetical protein ACRDSL_01885 [Pseudonocardiaceae bacterium]
MPGGQVGPPPGQVLRYDTTAYTVTPPAPLTGTTPAARSRETQQRMADFTREVQRKQAAKPPELGPTVTVAGVNRGSTEELFLWNVLVQLGTNNRWGTEVDLVTDIGWAPAAAQRAPVGRVTLRIDGQGNATATLLAAGPVPAVLAFPDLNTAIAALRQTFGFASVRDGSARWIPADLAKVHAALSRMPAADRSALDGVDLVRERQLTVRGEAAAGLFEHQASLTPGATTATRSAALKIADLAFAGDNVSFIGDAATGGPASFHTIVHEAGHAVETKALRDAQFARLQEQGRLNGAIADQNAAVTRFNTVSQAAFVTARTYPAAQQRQAAGFLRAINRATTAIQAMSTNDTPARNDALDNAASSALARRDRARTSLATAAATHPALTDFAATLTNQNNWHAAARIRAQVNAAVHQRQAEERAVSGAAGGSRRLENFVNVVNTNQIPPLTAYARRNWPANPDEFFAEAYSLWRNDRPYLQANAPALVTWFDSGGHLR